MKPLVVCYSNKGSNSYLARRIAGELSCEMEEIKPRLDVFTLFLMNIHLGIKSMKHNIKDYDTIILVRPIWMGKFIPPLRSFVKNYRDSIRKLIFVTCCGSPYSKKNEKFGHGLVFKEVERLLGDKCILCQAFPVGLVLPDDQKEDPQAFMKTHLNDDNFKGEIQERFDAFIKKIQETASP